MRLSDVVSVGAQTIGDLIGDADSLRIGDFERRRVGAVVGCSIAPDRNDTTPGAVSPRTGLRQIALRRQYARSLKSGQLADQSAMTGIGLIGVAVCIKQVRVDAPVLVGELAEHRGPRRR